MCLFNSIVFNFSVIVSKIMGFHSFFIYIFLAIKLKIFLQKKKKIINCSRTSFLINLLPTTINQH